jgi:hypothetical protein
MSVAIIENVQGESILDLGYGLLVLGVDVQNIPSTSSNRTPGNSRSKVAPPTMSAMRAVIA